MATEKLYPPYLKESIPAQTGTKLYIDFQTNNAVGIEIVQTMMAKIKTVSTNRQLGIFESEEIIENGSIYTAIFDISSLNLKQGQFYKLQLAYKNNESNIGYYSSVGIFKYTTNPILSIESLNSYEYIGKYSQEDGDLTERVYSYQFDMIHNDKIILSSGLKIHNSSEDNSMDSSYDSWKIYQQLDENLTYTIKYTVNTINGLTKSTAININNNSSTQEDLSNYFDFNGINNYENGYIELLLINKNNSLINDNFIISRTSSEDNFQTWNIFQEINISSSLPIINLKKDFTVKQGVEYKYSIQRLKTNSLSQRIETNIIKADFEDLFLWDGKQQLKIKFNPKVSTFKTTILENKIDTIGSKYPFFFRNGNVEYKQFSLSGLISYLIDNDELFISKNEIGFYGNEPSRSETESISELNYTNNSTQLDSENIFIERNFKNKVLDWLNNGEVKLFKSPTEGNYITRLTQISLSPNDTLGRMLHTFTATVYEVDDFSFENLIKYKFI